MPESFFQHGDLLVVRKVLNQEVIVKLLRPMFVDVSIHSRPFVQVGDDFAEGLEAQRFLFLGDDARENGNRSAVEPWMTSRLAIIEYCIFPLTPTCLGCQWCG